VDQNQKARRRTKTTKLLSVNATGVVVMGNGSRRKERKAEEREQYQAEWNGDQPAVEGEEERRSGQWIALTVEGVPL